MRPENNEAEVDELFEAEAKNHEVTVEVEAER